MKDFFLHKFIFVFAAIVVAVLCANVMGNILLDILFKPLIVVSLLAFLFVNGGHKERAAKLAAAGLIFSGIGDVLLIFQGRHVLFFIGGLVSFLVAHLLYIAYYIHSSNNIPQKTLNAKWIYFLLILIYGSVFYSVLYNNLGELKLPVVVYTAVLMGMNVFALNRYGKVNEKSFVLVIAGALFFTLSDSLLALNKFLFPVPLAGVWIMITYAAAQYLITKGVIISPRPSPQERVGSAR